MTDEIEKGPQQVKEIKSNGHDLNFYRFVINSLPIAVATVNSEFKITGFNQWAEQLTGYSEKEAIGHFCGDILQGGMCKINCPLRAVIKKRQTVIRMDTDITHRSGKTIPVRIKVSLVFLLSIFFAIIHNFIFLNNYCLYSINFYSLCCL